jgi:hypothetical protein
MSYSDSSHFSDSKTYKTLFISSYQSKDMNFCKICRNFRKTEKLLGTFLTQMGLARPADAWAPRLTETLTKQGKLRWPPGEANKRGTPVNGQGNKISKKMYLLA